MLSLAFLALALTLQVFIVTFWLAHSGVRFVDDSNALLLREDHLVKRNILSYHF